MQTFEEEFKRVKSLPAGIMTSLLQEMSGKEKEVVFYVREDTKYIKKQRYKPVFQVRTQIINTKIVSAFLIMVNINNDSDLLYDSWINYSSPFGGIDLVETLTKQKYLKFIFIDEFGRERKSIEIDNSIKDELNTYTDNSVARYPWIMEEYDFIKKYTYQKYPTNQVLWNIITTKNQEDISINDLRKAGKKGSITAKEIIYFKTI